MKMIASVSLLALALVASPAFATPVLVSTNVDLASPYTFSFGGVDFTFGSNISGITVQNSANGAIQAFGFLSIPVRPSSSFINRGDVGYGPTGTQFASFLTPTLDPSATGESFIGLRAGNSPNALFGFAYLTGTTLRGFGYETTANTAITATTTVAAVPEASTWALMLVGLGGIGFAMRHRKNKVRTVVTFA